MGVMPNRLNRVALLYATFPRPTETFVRREIRAMHEHGFTPTLFSIWKGQREWKGIKIQRFKMLKLWTLLFWLPYWAFKKPRAFREVLIALWSKSCPSIQNWNETFLGLGFALVEAHQFRVHRYQLFHAVWATMPGTAAFALSKLLDVPFSMGAHAYDLFRAGGDWLLSEKFTKASMIRTSSNSSANRLIEMGLELGKIKVIRRGLTAFPERSSYSLHDCGRISLISVGRLVEKKGYFYLLQILKLLRSRAICNFQMKIVGNGPLKSDLEKEIQRLGISAYAQLVGARSEGEVKKLFIESDAMLFTGIISSNGDRDGIPNVIPEAMSYGLLVMGSNQAGASEAFADRESGYSLDPYQKEPWVHILHQFYQHPEKFTAMRKLARSRAQTLFSAEQNCQKLKNLFK